ncbi:protein kinase domain-containing protein [Geminocystis sp. NIES-3709]|uniref:protein kinase domain-containing protein n=1 Tax=Geminocystis sp. NIES-3709 TaxID=1617448 RepID=UPI0005FCA4D5|nr:PhnD/SsuA/transferrin family substrate-binding protein [Geminocystis sp. NIES-3709]BAQ63920.1 serine/threonine kinase [Geminocystis sp. NIES-3709]
MLEISPNFSFLTVIDLAELATLAEKYYQSDDPNTSLIKSRQFIEVCAKYVSAKIGIYEEIKKEKLIYIINTLHKEKAIYDRIYYLFNDVRKLANSEVHISPKNSTTIENNNSNKANSSTALRCIKKIHKIAIWFHKVYCLDPKKPFQEPTYIVPPDPNDLMKQLQEKIEELDRQNEEMKTKQVEVEIKQRKLELEKEQENLAHEKEEINNRIESNNLDKELTRISQETILKPEVIRSNIKKAGEIDSQTILGTGENIESEESNKLTEGQILRHHYLIATELSSGSFGTTYIAHDLDQPNQPICVVKQFTPQQSSDGTFSKALTLFNQEAETLQKLGNHLEIPRLYAFFEENNNLFLVQEYIEGNTLRDELDTPWEEKEVIQLLKDILTPLVFIHQNEIIHRDIKPENLIRRVVDNKIGVIDFGAVKQVLLEEKNKQATVIGTKSYMSPEQYMGTISYSCDIYAVGVIAIEAITGRKIPEGLSSKQYLEEITFISDGLKQILLKMTAFSPENRYSSAQEVLDAIDIWEKQDDKTPTIINPPTPIIETPPVDKPKPEPPTVTPPTPVHSWWQTIPKLWLIGGGVASVLLLGLFIKSLPYLTKTKLVQIELTLGTLWKPENLQGLIEHVEDNSVPANYFDFLKGDKVKVLANGDISIPYTEAEKRIETKEWDIAFATSPILSIFAKDQGYTHLAGMFPGSTHYQSGFFVRANSPIQSLNNINSNTRVALGGFNSASSFYLPVYDLYGKTITADTGNRSQTIIELVKEGKADVGVAAIGDSIKKDDSDFRIIHVSRDIPGSAVYASPSLSQKDRDNIQKLMLSASPEVQEKANYGEKPEADYTEFRKIITRVQEILVCSDFTQNPVTLACTGNIQTIQGKINGVSIEGDNFILKVSGDGQIHNILIPVKMTTELFGSDKLTDIQGKSVIVKSNQISGNSLKINQSEQVKVSE